MKKRIGSVLLALTLCLSLLPATALATDEGNLSPVYVGGVQLKLDTKYVNNSGSVTESTSDNDNYNAMVTGDATNGYTLILNGLDVTGKTDIIEQKWDYKRSAIYNGETASLTVQVNGASTVTGALPSMESGYSAGIYSKGALTIVGTTKLTAKGPDASNTYGMSCGIASSGNMYIQGTVEAVGGNVTGSLSNSYGIKCDDALTIQDSTLTATGGTAKEYSVGMYGKSITIDGDYTEINTNGGNGASRSYGINGQGIATLNGGTVYAQAAEKSNNKALAIPFNTSIGGKEVKYTDSDNTISKDYHAVSEKTSLTVTLGDPDPVYHTVCFHTNGGKLTGTGVTTVTENDLYTMTYQVGVGMTLPRDTVTKEGYTFVGWYSNLNFTSGSGPDGTISAESNRDFIYYAKWEQLDFSNTVINLGTQGIYNGTIQAVVIDSVTLAGKTLTKDVDYEIVSGGTATNVENTTLKIQGIGAYSGTKTINWSLQKASPSLYVDFAQSVIDTLTNGVDYTGKPIRIATPLKEGKSGMGSVDTYYKASGNTTAYSAAKDAGEYSVTFDIKEGQNYKATTLTVGTLTVKKIDYTGVKNQSVDVRYDKANKDIAVALPAIPEGATYGDVTLGSTYRADGTAYGYTIFPSGQRGRDGDTLYVTTNSAREAGVYADITIPVTGAKNYKDYTITVRVTCVDRTEVTFSGIEDNQSFVYDGTAKTPAGTLTVSGGVDAADLEVQYASVSGGVATPISGAPTDVGTYQVTYSVPDSNDLYRGSVTYSFSIVRRSSSSSSSRPSYPITTPDKTENGSVTVTPKSAKQGNTVTITVTPDAGYVLDKLTVTDKDGKELSLTKKSDTEYTFVMPAGKVEITPSFVKQAEEPSRDFVDVKTGDYFYDAVRWAVEKGITNGTSAETFSPEDPCTRAQIVTFLWRAAGSPVVNYAMNLSDVAEDAYYAEAVRWALSEGITTGTSDHTFSPDATCTREQAVTFLYRAAGSPAVSGESAFEDVGADAYYARAVAWAAQNGVTNGISQTLFGSGNDCTRAQIVTFLYRAQQGK